MGSLSAGFGVVKPIDSRKYSFEDLVLTAGDSVSVTRIEQRITLAVVDCSETLPDRHGRATVPSVALDPDEAEQLANRLRAAALIARRWDSDR